MNTIKKQPDLGGNLALYFVSTHRIDHISGQKVYYTGSDPTFEIECQSESIRHISKLTEKDGSPVYDHEVKAFVPGRSDLLQTALDLLRNFRCMVILKNADGNYRRIGDGEVGLKFDYDHDTSDDPSKTEGYSISFTGSLVNDSMKVQFPLIPFEN